MSKVSSEHTAFTSPQRRQKCVFILYFSSNPSYTHPHINRFPKYKQDTHKQCTIKQHVYLAPWTFYCQTCWLLHIHMLHRAHIRHSMNKYVTDNKWGHGSEQMTLIYNLIPADQGPSLWSPITRHNVRLIWLQKKQQQVFRQNRRDFVTDRALLGLRLKNDTGTE